MKIIVFWAAQTDNWAEKEALVVRRRCIGLVLTYPKPICCGGQIRQTPHVSTELRAPVFFLWEFLGAFRPVLFNYT